MKVLADASSEGLRLYSSGALKYPSFDLNNAQSGSVLFLAIAGGWRAGWAGGFLCVPKRSCPNLVQPLKGR